VPAWAEPIGELGTIRTGTLVRAQPYAEWYFNTIRIEEARRRSTARGVRRGAVRRLPRRLGPNEFDADEFPRAGEEHRRTLLRADHQHHDGVTLWDAPGTDGRNTVARGPRRDWSPSSSGPRNAGLRFGVYYSGGLDWHFTEQPPITNDSDAFRAPDRCRLRRIRVPARRRPGRAVPPHILWGDIEWPDAGKPRPVSMENLFEKFYAAAPDGVANDRWGEDPLGLPHQEYQSNLAVEGEGGWENCRGIGYSFGYNALEDESHMLSGPDAVKSLVDHRLARRQLPAQRRPHGEGNRARAAAPHARAPRGVERGQRGGGPSVDDPGRTASG